MPTALLVSPPEPEEGRAARRGRSLGTAGRGGTWSWSMTVGSVRGLCACVLACVCQVSVSIVSGCVCVSLSLLCGSVCMCVSLSQQLWLCLSLCVTPTPTYQGTEGPAGPGLSGKPEDQVGLTGQQPVLPGRFFWLGNGSSTGDSGSPGRINKAGVSSEAQDCPSQGLQTPWAEAWVLTAHWVVSTTHGPSLASVSPSVKGGGVRHLYHRRQDIKSN